MMSIEGRRLTIARKRARRDPGSIFYQGPPVAPTLVPPHRKPFGAGILASRPVHRLPVPIADLEWYEQQIAVEEERLLEERYEEFRVQERLEAGLDPL